MDVTHCAVPGRDGERVHQLRQRGRQDGLVQDGKERTCQHDADDGDFLASYFVLFSNQLLFVQERIDFLCGRVDDRADTLARAQEGARRERPAIDRGI